MKWIYFSDIHKQVQVMYRERGIYVCVHLKSRRPQGQIIKYTLIYAKSEVL